MGSSATQTAICSESTRAVLQVAALRMRTAFSSRWVCRFGVGLDGLDWLSPMPRWRIQIIHARSRQRRWSVDARRRRRRHCSKWRLPVRRPCAPPFISVHTTCRTRPLGNYFCDSFGNDFSASVSVSFRWSWWPRVAVGLGVAPREAAAPSCLDRRTLPCRFVRRRHKSCRHT